jgi:dihydroneopterin aldolase/D-erythro-7,8-dihydroneopterin triphosphate epimerase
MDKLYIRDLSVECIIGTRPEERRKKQPVLINVELECDLAPAGRSDDLQDTVNYSELQRQIAASAAEGEFFLIERLAEVVARICLADKLVVSSTVTVDKPGALANARSAAVCIRREKST